MMSSYSKIGFFFIILALGISISSCNKKNDVIPDTYVSFSIDLYDPEFLVLSAIGSSITVDAHTNNLGSGAAGYDGNGIIIHAGVDEFFAYDRTCPHDYALNKMSIRVNIDSTNSLYALCPKCGTLFALSAGGTPASGPSRYPLKNYKTSFYGRNIFVSNY